MAADAVDLGDYVGTHGPSRGFTGLQQRPRVRTALLTLAGLFFGLVPGLVVWVAVGIASEQELDVWPALIIGPLLGAAAAFLWARSWKDEAAVMEARLYARGVVFVDRRGTHQLSWDQIASVQGRHVQQVARTPVGDVRGVTTHTYVLRTRDGTGFWLDDRVDDVAGLVEAVARASHVVVTPLS